MKLITASVVSSMICSSLSALILYKDPASGQVFTDYKEGMITLGNFTNTDEASPSYSESKVHEPAKKTKDKITIIDQKSPEFLLGQQTHINMKIAADDNPEMWLKAGVRIQGTFENVDSNKEASQSDAYLRRVRFEVAAGFDKHTSFVMDVRNDKADLDQKGEQEFNVGDAYVQIKQPFSSSLTNFRFYRAKIDVSRTETVKSSRVIAYDRPKIADYAAQYISHNRRGTNAQMYGDWNKKIHYQIAAGDATYEGSLADAKGQSDGTIDNQTLFYGGKLSLSPFDGWEEIKKTETYFAKGKHIAVGLGYWNVPSIKATGADATSPTVDLHNELINVEASAHYHGFFVQGEYFKFKDTVKDWNAAGSLERGESSGWYATSEYVMKDFYYLSPFVRYESWDRFEKESGYDYEAKMAGINWYLRGNTTKVGLYMQKEKFGANIGDEEVNTFRLTSQFFF